MQSQRETLLCHYAYDALDRVISHRLTDSLKLQRFYCKSRLATEIQGAIKHSIVQHGDLLLAQQQRQEDAIDTTLLATDLQRSVLHTLKANYPRQPIIYFPYGYRRADSGLTSLLGFNGERPDSVTGHYLLGNGYRAFNPMLMRFNSPDSWSPFGKGGLNSYAYCLGDPTNRTDQTGRSPSPELLGTTHRPVLGVSASPRLNAWRAPVSTQNRPTPTPKSLMTRALESTHQDAIPPEIKRHPTITEILETEDPYNFNIYEDLKHFESHETLPSKRTYRVDKKAALLTHFSRKKLVTDEIRAINLTLSNLEKPFTPKIVGALNEIRDEAYGRVPTHQYTHARFVQPYRNEPNVRLQQQIRNL